MGYAACIIWDKIPLNFKEISVYQFSEQLKPYLLSFETASLKIVSNLKYIYNFKIWSIDKKILGLFQLQA